MKKTRKIHNQEQRQKRVRSKITDSIKHPRLSVFRSNKYIYAQIINDEAGKIITSASNLKLSEKNKIKSAALVGETIAKQALENNINQVVFDRGSYKYHGQVKALAEGAREAGLKF